MDGLCEETVGEVRLGGRYDRRLAVLYLPGPLPLLPPPLPPGQGLGREKNGIADPIKVKIKRDAGGVSPLVCETTLSLSGTLVSI